MALDRDAQESISELTNALQVSAQADIRNDRYYEGAQRLEHIGLAVPPELRRFETMVNWPRLVVDSLNERLEVQSFVMPGEELPDPTLLEAWDENDLDSEAPKAHLEAFIYGRSFVCVGANGDDPEHPLITVESPRELAVQIDTRTRQVLKAWRPVFDLDGPSFDPNPIGGTYYTPDSTIWAVRKGGIWVEDDRDDHGLGVVPVQPFYNRLRPGRWRGVSEMADVIGLTDAAARTLTNLQIAGETHSVPQKWVLGMSKGDFVDASGNPIPAWESYFSAIWANQNDQAKVGQFTASSLSNFHDTVNHYGRLVSATSGLPPHFLGFPADTPPSAAAIKASESRLVKRAELKQLQFGDAWGRVMSLYLAFRGEKTDGNRIKVEWQNANTPTIAEQADAVMKLHSEGILSREGAWDDLGWSEARKARERAYFEAEARQAADDPILAAILKGANDANAQPPASA